MPMNADVARDALRRLARLLAEWPHGAAIVGDVAISARVRPRLTDDVDVVIAVPAGELPALLALARHHGFVEDDAPGAKELAAAGLLRLWSSESPMPYGIDLMFVDSDHLEQTVRRSTQVDVGVGSLPIATVEDLLLLKLEAHRPHDIDDILAIKDAHGATLDLDYVRRVAARLDLGDRLTLCFAQ